MESPGLSGTRGSRWPVGGGEMGALIRAYDWAARPLGPSEAWSLSLTTTVDICLGSAFPMIVLWGPDLVQVYNDGYRALMGVKHPAGLGQATRACWPEVWPINEPIYAQVWAGDTLTFEDKLYPITRHGDPEDAWFTLCYSPLRDEASAIAGILVTVFETTDRVLARHAEARAEVRAEAELRRAEAALRLRNDFLTVAAHDLRTPLTNIRGRAELVAARLRRGQDIDPAWHAEQLASLVASTKRLLATVDEFNDIARLEMGEALDLDVEGVDLGALARAVADEVAQGSGAQSQGATAIAVAAPEEPLVVAGDRGRLARVLQNVIGNAVKYSPSGAPVAVEARRAGATAVVVVVRDRGVGIPAAELPRVFERFYRASTARGIKGSGIGLSGVQAIVAQHGGTLAIESAEGEGTTVTIVLPVAPDAAGPRRRAPAR